MSAPARCFTATSSGAPSCMSQSSRRLRRIAISTDVAFHDRRRPAFRSLRCELRDINASSVSALEKLKDSSIDRYVKERVSIGVVGINFHTAPAEMLEKLAIPETELQRKIEELCSLNHIDEAAILSTCNRTEIYVVALSWHRGIKEVKEWMAKISKIPISEIHQHLFLLRDSDAVRHLFQVSAGLDSLVLGEGQIFAQVKQLVSRSEQGSLRLGKTVGELFKHAIKARKRVSNETNIESGAVSISSAAVELAMMKIGRSQFLSARMLVIGAGKMGKLVIRHLAAKGCKRVIVVNRSVQRVNAIQEELKGVQIVYRPDMEMLTSAAEADVVFTSTDSEKLLILKEHVKDFPPASEALGGRRLFVDIAVPRNVESSMLKLDSAQVYNVDDLKEVVEANKEDCLKKTTHAEAGLTKQLKHFEAWRDSQGTNATIKNLRSFADRIVALELEKFFQKIGDYAKETKIRNAGGQLCSRMINKFLDGPTQHLRCDGSGSRTLDETIENMNAVKRMFTLDMERSILEQMIKDKVDKNEN